jgi:hypothetical protein
VDVARNYRWTSAELSRIRIPRSRSWGIRFISLISVSRPSCLLPSLFILFLLFIKTSNSQRAVSWYQLLSQMTYFPIWFTPFHCSTSSVPNPVPRFSN